MSGWGLASDLPAKAPRTSSLCSHRSVPAAPSSAITLRQSDHDFETSRCTTAFVKHSSRIRRSSHCGARKIFEVDPRYVQLVALRSPCPGRGSCFGPGCGDEHRPRDRQPASEPGAIEHDSAKLPAWALIASARRVRLYFRRPSPGAGFASCFALPTLHENITPPLADNAAFGAGRRSHRSAPCRRFPSVKLHGNLRRSPCSTVGLSCIGSVSSRAAKGFCFLAHRRRSLFKTSPQLSNRAATSTTCPHFGGRPPGFRSPTNLAHMPCLNLYNGP